MKTITQLKFRVWDKVTKKMLSDFHLFGEVTLVGGIHSWQHEEAASIGITRDTLGALGDLVEMQFTGLKDKNGKDIYEGDILKKMVTDYEHEDYQAFVDSGYETIEPIKEIRDFCSLERFRYWLKNESFGYEGEDLESPSDWEVIGNIYQNPDLL